MNKLALCILALNVQLVLAAGYHFASNGDDSYSAAQAQNAATPWKSFSKLSGVTLHAADSVLLNAGDTLRGQITINGSGSASSPIVVTSYGIASAKPLVLGTESVSGFTQGAGSILTATLSAVARAGDHLFLNGVPLRAAREPDTGWFSIDTGFGDSAFNASALAGKNWQGAKVHVKSETWNIDARTITAQNGNRISLSSPVNGSLRKGWGFFVNGSINALNQPGEWFYDSTTHVLSVIPLQGVDLSTATLELASAEYGVLVVGSYVHIENVAFAGQGSDAIHSTYANNLVVKGCDILDPDQFGINVAGTNMTLQNNSMRGSNAGGIYFYGVNGLIENNRIRFVNDFASLGPRGESGACCTGRGIDAYGDSLVMRGNDLDSIGYIGMFFGGQKSLVENNLVDHACLTTHDCGGIYTWTGNANSGNNYQHPGAKGSEVTHNVVRNSFGNPQGCPGYTPQGHGIYLDDGSQSMFVHDNVVYNNVNGIVVHNNRDGKIIHNISFGNRQTQILVARDSINTDIMYGNNIDSNVLVGLNGVPTITEVKYAVQDSALAHYANNTQCTDDPFQASCRTDGGTSWSTQFVDLAAYSATSPELMRNGTFESGASGWYAWPAQVSMTLVNAGCRTTQCLQISQVAGMGGITGLVTDGLGKPVVQSELYMLSFWAKNSKAGAIRVKVRQNHNPYSNVAPDLAVYADTSWQHFMLPFHIQQSDTSARIDFDISEGDSLYVIDDVSWKKMDPAGIDTTLHAYLEVNATTSGAVVSLDQAFLWRLPLGTQAPAALSLSGFSGAVVFKDSTTLQNLPVRVNTVQMFVHPESRLRIVFRQGGIQIEKGSLRMDIKGRRVF